MRTLALVAVLSLVSGAALARAQEQAPPPADQEGMENAPTHHIQVLQNPYEIASFYRSSQQSAVGFGYEPTRLSPYPIASFYRSQQAPGSYGMFWTNGYGYGNVYGAQGHGRVVNFGHSRPLGLNGDLCLFAPTFLAPVGPLTGAFFEGR